MDPISQACFGASLSQSFARDRVKQLTALAIGALAGMAPDLDLFIKSSTDSLLFLEFHRQFTHSLIFIPFGALLCAWLFHFCLKLTRVCFHPDRTTLSFQQIYLFAFLGYASHGLLDACTSYGTQLYWPFSDQRVAWNIISIVDPFFTLPIMLLILLAVFRNNVRYAQAAFAYAILFLALGLVQKQRAEDAINALAQQRGHLPVRTLQKPSFANRHVWKIMYEYNDRYYVDAVKLLWHTEYILGASIQKLNIKRDFPWLPANSQQAIDIERFRWFSNDFLAVSTQHPNIITDVRYSFLPNQINFMWGIELNKEDIAKQKLEAHVQFKTNRGQDEITRKKFIDMLF
jgi:inner membrane protein